MADGFDVARWASDVFENEANMGVDARRDSRVDNAMLTGEQAAKLWNDTAAHFGYDTEATEAEKRKVNPFKEDET